MCNFIALSAVTALWNHGHNRFWDAPSPQRETLYSLAVTPHFSLTSPRHPQPTATLLSVSEDLPMGSIFRRWNHVIRRSLGLASFTEQHVSRVQPCTSIICFYCQLIFHCMVMSHFTCQLMDIWEIPTFFAVINNAAMDIYAQGSV